MPIAGLTSAFAAVFTALLTGFDSDFLVVTGTFCCEEAAWAAALDKGFAFDGTAVVLVPAFDTDLATAFGDALPEDFSIAALGFTTLALPEGFVAAAFFITGFTAAFRGAGLAAADFALFAADVRGFAVFFIAFAMESITS